MKTKVDLKNVRRLFRKGVHLGEGMNHAVASVTLHALGDMDCNYSRVGTIDRDEYLDLTARQLKHKIIEIRNRAISVQANRRHWMLEVQCCGDGSSRKLRVDGGGISGVYDLEGQA